jgi:ribosome-associated heat shock protein Hsp15
VRIDKWLWAVRVYKTRGLAAAACRNHHVMIAGQPVKPSRPVKPADLILARNGDVARSLRVLGLVERRVGASAVNQFMEDLTPRSELQKPRDPVLPPIFFRPKGMGRPTKKDRRALSRIEDSFQL